MKVAFAITLLDSWVIFEEFVVDRRGLWRYMPFYRVGDPCAWDLAVAILITTGFGGSSGGRARNIRPAASTTYLLRCQCTEA